MHRATCIHKINTTLSRMNDGRPRSRSNMDKDEVGVIEGGVEEKEKEKEEEAAVAAVVVAGTVMGTEMGVETGMEAKAMQSRKPMP